MDFNQLIKNWHTKASNEDYFSGFVFEYLAFIAFLKRKKYVEQDKDWEALRSLKNDQSIRDNYLQKIDSTSIIKNAWQNIKDELDQRPLGNLDENTDEVRVISYWRCSCFNLRNRANHTCNEQGKIGNLQDWENMVEFWHSIRNNLFHGGKNPQDRRDQILIENGYKTLHPLVGMLLSQENI